MGSGRSATIAHRVNSAGVSGSASPYYTRSKDIHLYSNRPTLHHHHTVPTNTLKYYIHTQRVSASVYCAHRVPHFKPIFFCLPFLFTLWRCATLDAILVPTRKWRCSPLVGSREKVPLETRHYDVMMGSLNSFRLHASVARSEELQYSRCCLVVLAFFLVSLLIDKKPRWCLLRERTGWMLIA